jgi:PKD repeat protein
MPANLTLLAGANCQAVASWMAPSFADNCGIKGFTVSHPAGTAFGLGQTTVTYAVEDHSGNAQQASFTVTVTNAAPQLTQINAPAAPVAVINAVPVSITFADHNLTSALIEWGDGSADTYAAGDANTLAGSHLYAMPGLYALKVTLTDACGAQASSTYEYVMVNAPADGFITGGGWINSPAGALVGTTAMGKASYSFDAKYNPATGLSSGSATFDFPAGALNFASTRIDWLVVADAKAWIKGVGTVNGVSGYSFLLSAVDSELNGYRNTDTFRMQIWNGYGVLVYDNQPNVPRHAPAGQVIAGGSIVVHKAKETTALAASANRMGAEGTGEQVSLGLKAYPNPSAGHFRVTANENLTADAQVTVLDLRGQPVYRGVLEANGSRTLEVDLAGKGAGLYVVQVQAAGRREVLKLVKQ